MVVKINVCFPEDILQKLDRAAKKRCTSRSAFLTQAVKHYLQEKEEEELLEQRRQAAEAIDRLREEFGAWDGTAEVLKWRDRH